MRSKTMGSSNSNEAEASARQKKFNVDLDRIEKDMQRAEETKRQRAEEAEKQQRAEEAERQRALDAETISLNMNGPDGKFDHDARLNGTIQELTEKVVLKFGLPKECAKDVDMHLSGYKLAPLFKIVREFTELCTVTMRWCNSRE